MTDQGYAFPPGTVHLSHREDSIVELLPIPTSDPNDPLNWPKIRKFINFSLTFAVTVVIFSQLSIQTVFWQDLVPDLNVDYNQLNIALAINYAGTGCGGFLFIPLAIKYGRRPVYLISTAIMAATCFWTARVGSVKSLYATNLISGLAGSTNETIVQMTIVDLFFIHQRSRMYGVYSLAATIGSFLVPLAAGAQATAQGWRWSYWTLGIVSTVVFFCFLVFFEESKYVEHFFGQSVPGAQNVLTQTTPAPTSLKGEITLDTAPQSQPWQHTLSENPSQAPKSYRQRMRFITPTKVDMWHLFYRPLEALFFLPAVMFSAIQYRFILAWCAVFTSAQAIYMPYDPWNFGPTQIGCLMLAPFIGLVLGLATGGYVGDKMIVYFSKRNNGIYEPEMRLYAQIVPCIVSTTGFLIFGIYLSDFSHWAKNSAGTLIYGLGWGMGLNGTTYAMDSYSEVIGEAFVSISFVRNIFSVILLFALEPWFEAEGLRKSFITMGVMCFVIQLLFIPMIMFGKKARVRTAS